MAVELAEARNGLEVGVYATAPVGEIEEPGPVPGRWGATDERNLATWVPSEKMPDTGVEVIRHNDAARTSLHTRVIASSIGADIEDGGAAWRAAIKRGRSIQGAPNAPDVATTRAPRNVRTEAQAGATDFSISIEKGAVTARGPIRTHSEAAESCDQLYAHVRGTLAAAYGEPQSESEHAMDALAASIITSRGTNGCGLGWTPPEPERLRAAGLELQRDPSRLEELGAQIDTVEKVFYPPWPGLHLTRTNEHAPDKPKDIFDDQRQAYAERHQEWGNERNERARRILQDAPAEPPTESPKPARPPAAPEPREHPSPSR